MLPNSLAIAWVLWREHRWTLLAIVGYLLVAVIVSAVVPAHVSPGVAPVIFGPMTVPMVGVLLCFLGAFSYGLDPQDVVARQSCFPPRLFTLPVRTRALAGWPMLYGAVAVASLWLITAGLILPPWLKLLDEPAPPLWWPALLAMAS